MIGIDHIPAGKKHSNLPSAQRLRQAPDPYHPAE